MSELVRFGVSLEQDLLTAFDELCCRRGYSNRSEALRHCIRRELDDDRAADPHGPAAGVLTLVYDHRESDLPRRLTAMQHEAHHAVLATLHVHLDRSHCLEVMTLRGTASQVRELADHLSATRGVLQAALTLTPLQPGSAGPAACGSDRHGARA